MESVSTAHRRLCWLLRVVGTLDLLAFAAMVAPVAWLSDVQQSAGLGALPDGAVTIYLVRTASMLYGLCGGLLLFLSTDVVRYAPVIRWISGCGVFAGLLLLAIDLASGMPFWWAVVEGPACSLIWGMVWLAASSLRTT